MLSRCFLDFTVGVGAFFSGTESDLYFFLLLLMGRFGSRKPV